MISTLACPSDASYLPTFTVVDFGTTTATSLGTPLCDVSSSNYVGSFGTSDPSGNPAQGDPPPGRDAGQGVFFRNRPVSIAEILDGTSQTFAVGERSQNLSRGSWVGAITNAGVPVLELQSGGYSPEGGGALTLSHTGEGHGPNTPSGGAHADQYWSRHPGGANFLFADGSVRFINEQVGFPVFKALATRKGGEVVSADQF